MYPIVKAPTKVNNTYKHMYLIVKAPTKVTAKVWHNKSALTKYTLMW